MKMLTGLCVLGIFAISTLTGFADSKPINFQDVKADDWYYKYVQVAVSKNLLSGKSKTKFSPDDNLTIAEAIKVAAILHNNDWEDKNLIEKEGYKDKFPKTDPWYESYANYLHNNNVIDKSKYKSLDAPISKSEFFIIIRKVFVIEHYDWINVIDDGSIPGIDMNKEWGETVLDHYRAGVLTGDDEFGSFKPKDYIKRSEAAAIFARLCDENLRVYKKPVAKEYKWDGDDQLNSGRKLMSCSYSFGGGMNGGRYLIYLDFVDDEYILTEEKNRTWRDPEYIKKYKISEQDIKNMTTLLDTKTAQNAGKTEIKGPFVADRASATVSYIFAGLNNKQYDDENYISDSNMLSTGERKVFSEVIKLFESFDRSNPIE